MTLLMSSLTIFLLIFYINTVLSSDNTTQFDNFTIEWINFNIFACAIPVTINVSLFSCVPPKSIQVDNPSCLQDLMIDFQENTCQSTTMMTTLLTISGENVNQPWSSITTTTTTTTTDTSSTTGNIGDAVTQSSSTTASGTTQFLTVISSTTQSFIPASIPRQFSTPISIAAQSSVATSATAQSLTPTSITAQSSTSSITHSSSTIVLSGTAQTSITNTDQTSVTLANNTSHASAATTTAARNPYHCPGDTIGSYCNITSDICVMSQPCLNAGTCYPNNTLPLGYTCQCQAGYTGKYCQNDERICKENTCWHNGTCTEINSTISGGDGANFHCECDEAFTGLHCELKIDLCGNITCLNKGICQTINLVWKCTCLDRTLYYGDYCQLQTNTLQLKKVLSRSFASVAITVIAFTCSFVLLMDILKYVFHIDPVKTERRKRRQEQEEKRAAKSKAPKVAVRFQYVA